MLWVLWVLWAKIAFYRKTAIESHDSRFPFFFSSKSRFRPSQSPVPVLLKLLFHPLQVLSHPPIPLPSSLIPVPVLLWFPCPSSPSPPFWFPFPFSPIPVPVLSILFHPLKVLSHPPIPVPILSILSHPLSSSPTPPPLSQRKQRNDTKTSRRSWLWLDFIR